MLEPIAASFIDQRPRPAAPQAQELTSVQVDIVNEILSNFDGSNLSDRDIAEINETLTQVGIKPSASLRETVEAAGFNPEDLIVVDTQQSGPEELGPQRPDFIETLTNILADFDTETLSEDDLNQISEKLVAEGFSPPAPGAQLVQIDA